MKVLILTGKFGMGHISVSRSLRQQILERFPEAQVHVEDIFAYMLPKGSKLIYRMFSTIMKRGSRIYNLFYQISEDSAYEKRAKLPRFCLRKVKQLIEETEPTVVLSTFPICSWLVSDYKEYYDATIPLVTCITDISCHSDWLTKNADFYLVAAQSVKDALIDKGIRPDQIHVNGIPVRKEFKELRHVGGKEKTILIMGGGLGLLPCSELFYQELNGLKQVKTVVITGNNKKLYQHLYGKYPQIEVVGYTDQVPQYMERADVIISKPGGITLFETIFSELPILVPNPFLQQEIDNAAFICERGIGRILQGAPEDFIEEIKRLIYDDQALNEYRLQLRRLKEQIHDRTVENLLFALECRERAIHVADFDYLYLHGSYAI